MKLLSISQVYALNGLYILTFWFILKQIGHTGSRRQLHYHTEVYGILLTKDS